MIIEEEEEKQSPFEQEFKRIFDQMEWFYGEYRIDEAVSELQNLRLHVNENAQEDVSYIIISINIIKVERIYIKRKNRQPKGSVKTRKRWKRT